MARKCYFYIVLLSVISTILIVASVIGIFLKGPSPSRAFRKLVWSPILKSVEDIKMDRRISVFGSHWYVFQFRVDKQDLSLILNSRAFQKVPSIKFTESGQLWWGDPMKGGHSLSLYYPVTKRHAPVWFNLRQWNSPNVYVIFNEHVIRSRLLVYNENLGEAYFIDVRLPD